MNRSPSDRTIHSSLSILFVDSERRWRGGQAQLFPLLQGLQSRGHSIHLVCFPGTSLENRARKLGISVHPAAIWSEIGLISFIRLFFIIRKTHPDILAFNTPKPILIGNLASRFSPVGARIIFRRVIFPLRQNRISRLKYTWGIDRIIAISSSIKSQLQKGGIPDSLIEIIFEGIDIKAYPENPVSRTRLKSGRITVGTVSHLSPEKGLHNLIEAASLIPDVKNRFQFVIAGDGSCRPELETLVREKGLESCFQFLGFRSDSHLIMKDFDLFVLPSLSEGLSTAIMEAMANGLPVIGSNVGGTPELVHNGYNGILFPPGDSAKLAAAIQELTENAENLSLMGRRGRKRIEETFTLERKILETEKMCHTLLGKKHSNRG